MIQEHQTLELYNILSYRGRMTQQELNIKAQEIDSLVLQSGAKKNAPVMTTTFSITPLDRQQYMDVEILIPLDREIPIPAGYQWKPHFLLMNALKVCHIGNPSGLQATANALNAYIMEHQLVPITTGYNVTVREAKTPLELDQVEVDIYVGISPNIL